MPQPRAFPERFRDCVIIVTGAGSAGDGIGIGRAIALAFAAEGARLCLIDRDAAQAERTLAATEAAGAQAIVCHGDVVDPDFCASAVRTTVAAFGGVDILVNNVGLTGPRDDLRTIDLAEWSATFDTNVRSALMMARGVVPPMIADGGGVILNITSVAGLLAHGVLAYGPSKAALDALTRELAVMHGRDGIRANSIAPGYLWTPMAERCGGGESARALRRGIAPLNAEGDAWDVASAALFLASDEARFITGATLPVDGGATIVAPLAAYGRLQTLDKGA